MAMGKLVVIKIGEGSFEEGFPVTLEIGEEGAAFPPSLNGNLPPEPQLPLFYNQWQSEYRSFFRLTLINKKAEELIKTLNNWLNSETFRPIKDKLLKQLQPNDTVQVIIQTEDPILRRLPWCKWDWFEDYTKAEVAISLHNYEKPSQLLKPKPKVRVLAILGECSHPNTSIAIDTDPDKQCWQNLSNDAETVFLKEPTLTLPELTKKLWEKPGWDILFFAGHSSSNPDATTGKMYITINDILTIPDLKLALKKAIERGLQLAIFNSCDGLGIAWDLAELHIPQMIVMREPVPDFVAQEFLKIFLDEFSSGQPLYIAVREAREQLEGLEKEYPCASWLPVICQNPTVKPVTWRGLLLGDIFQDISQSLSPSDWFWFCALGEDKKINESIQQAYRDSLPVDAGLWNLEGNNITNIIPTLAQYRRLPEFFNRLIQDEGLPPAIRGKLSDLFKIEKQPIAKINQTLESYLIVTVNKSDNTKELLLNAWLILDNSVVDDPSRFQSLLDDGNETQQGVLCKFNQIPEQVNKFIGKALRYLRGKKYHLTIEVFLPSDLIMCTEVDRWEIFEDKTTLGVEYPIRLRSLERLDLNYLERRWSDWSQQWDRVYPILHEIPNPELFVHLQEMENFNWKNLINTLKQKLGLKLTCAPPQAKREDLFKAILQATTPIAIWTRCPVDHCDLAAEIDRILTINNLSCLCESVQQVRAEADAQRLDDPTLDHLGFHLALLWEDPHRLTPDVMIQLMPPGQS
jgi:hypothetical protein